MQKAAASTGGARSATAGEGDAPPLSNTGGTETTESRCIELVLDDGKLVEIPARRGYGDDTAFIDWVNVTCHEETFVDDEDLGSFDTRRIIAQCSMICERIFGFGITSQRENGANFYQRSYSLGDNYGMVCHGGQKRSLLIMLSGSGCTAAKAGWEKRLYDWLENEAKSPRITRADLAHDDYEGTSYSVDQMKSDYENGLYNLTNRAPDCEMRGNWITPNGKGRTFYVGRAANGKLCRGYEKGKQLGCSKSPWMRVEGQLGSRDRIIPFDVLLKPGAYLAAMYPALGWISEKQERIATTRTQAKHDFDRQVEITRTQSGSAIWAIHELLGGDPEKTLQTLMRPGKVPRRLIVPHYEDSPSPIHAWPQFAVSEEAFMHRSFH